MSHRQIAALAVPLALAACVSNQSAETISTHASMAEPVSPGAAFAKLPAAAGAVISVTEERFPGSTVQKIALAGDAVTRGANHVTVAVLHDADPRDRAPEEPSFDPPDDWGIHVELKKAFPGVRMRVRPEMRQNAHGPFGYATGRSKFGETCFYGWQWLADKITLTSGDRYKPLRRKTPRFVRVRLCQKGVREATMVAYMEKMTLSIPAYRVRTRARYASDPLSQAPAGRQGAAITVQ